MSILTKMTRNIGMLHRNPRQKGLGGQRAGKGAKRWPFALPGLFAAGSCVAYLNSGSFWPELTFFVFFCLFACLLSQSENSFMKIQRGRVKCAMTFYCGWVNSSMHFHCLLISRHMPWEFLTFSMMFSN